MIEKNTLMLNDIVCDGDGHTGRIIALSEDEFLVRADGDEWNGDGTRPMLLTNEWIVNSKVHDICYKRNIVIDFSRKRKLKISIMIDKPNLTGEKSVLISYFYPMPQYVHELQHILRYFDQIEI